MDKQRLKSIIKAVVKSKLNPTTNIISLDNGDNHISLDLNSKFPILNQFSSLKDTIIDLFTTQYEVFISDIQWVAPRPTTFRIVLANDYFFYLIHDKRSWVAKIEGKRYYLNSLPEEENASEAIARLLTYGNPNAAPTATPEPKKETPEPKSKKEPSNKPVPEEKPTPELGNEEK